MNEENRLNSQPNAQTVNSNPAVMPTNATPTPTPQPQQAVQPQQTQVAPQSVQQPKPQPVQQPEPTVDPIAKVSNLNKEDAMEEALSHTTQYNPFEIPKENVETVKEEKKSDKTTWIFIGVIAAILILFIIFLPQISKLFGI